MSSIQRYLQMANRSVNEQFVGADGFLDDDMYFTGGQFFDTDLVGADGAAAAPAVAAPSLMRSQPYILTVSNASNAAVTIDIFGAYIYLNNAGFTAGSLTVSNVTITSNLSNVTYYNLLNQSSFSPFTIGSTLISSVNGTTSQVLQPITLTTQDANGNQAVKILTPVVDPYQNQSGIVDLKQPFRIDGFTKLTFQIFASTSVQFQFYPSDTINVARGLGGNPVSKQYGSPKIIRPAVR
jgi:hypothetical protein